MRFTTNVSELNMNTVSWSEEKVTFCLKKKMKRQKKKPTRKVFKVS